jgi:hypothetical protein
MTDEELVRASTVVDGADARYELGVNCQRELMIDLVTYEPLSTAGKAIRFRVGQDPPISATLITAGYVNRAHLVPDHFGACPFAESSDRFGRRLPR